MKVLGFDKMRLQLLSAYIGENIAGGYYHQLSKHYAAEAALAKRLRKTAGDEIRHGGYFSQCHAEHYGAELGFRDSLIRVGRAAASVDRWLPQSLLPKQARFALIARGEAAAVKVLEQQLRDSGPNPYLDVVSRILPDEHDHAEPYRW